MSILPKKGVFLLLVLFALASCTKNEPTLLEGPAQNVYQEKTEQTSADRQLQAVRDLGLNRSGDPLFVNPLIDEVLSVDAGGQQFSDSQLSILLAGQVVSGDGSQIKQTYWSQVAGPSAAIVNPASLTTQVLLPDVDQSQELSFRLSAVNGNRLANSDLTYVYVLPLGSSFYAESIVGQEGDEELLFKIRLKAAQISSRVFTYATADGTAKSGLDYIESSGQIVFESGQVEQSVPIPLLDDSFREGDEYLQLIINEVGADSELARRAIGLLKDNEEGEIGYSSAPVDEGPSDQDQSALGDPQGGVRFHLEWDNPAALLRLHVIDPCENDIQALQLEAECQNALGQYFTSGFSEVSVFTQDVVWQQGIPDGAFRSLVEHVSGEATDYIVRAFWRDQSQMYSGTIAGGDIVEFPTVEPPIVDSKPEDSSSSSSSSTSSSTSSSSSSSTSSSSSSSTSSSASSSTSSSSSSSASSSSGVPLSVAFEEVEQTIYTPEVTLKGYVAFDPSSDITELLLLVSKDEVLLEEFDLLAQGDWNVQNGNFSFDFSFEAQDLTAGFYQFEVVVQDSFDRKQTDSFSVEYVIPESPIVDLISPIEDLYVGSVLFQGRVLLAEQVSIEAISLDVESLQGRTETLDLREYLNEDGIFELDWQAETEGGHTATVTLIDSLGRRDSVVVNFNVEPVKVTLDPLPLLNFVEDDVYSALGAFAVDVLVLSNTNINNNTFSIELNEGDVWRSIATFKSEDVWDSSLQTARLVVSLTGIEPTAPTYSLRVRLDYNEANFSTSPSFEVRYLADTVPTIRVDSPVETLYTTSIDVSGLVEWAAYFDSMERLSISGQLLFLDTESSDSQTVPLSLDGNGFFGYIDSANLSVGSYLLRVIAEVDGYQSNIVERVFSYRSLIPLAIGFDSIDEEVINPEWAITGKVTFDLLAPIQTIELLFLDSESEGLVINVQDQGVWDSETGVFSVPVDFDLLGLSTGVHSFELRVEDERGRVFTESIDVNYRVPVSPEIEFLLPESGTLFYTPVSIVGQVTIAPELDLKSLVLTLEGEQLAPREITSGLSADGSFSASVLPSLSGEYTIRATVVDSFDRVQTQSRDVIYETPNIGVEYRLVNTVNEFEVLESLLVDVYLLYEGDFEIDGFALERLVEGQWIPLDEYDPADVYFEPYRVATLPLNFEALGLVYDDYALRIKVDYASSQSHYTELPVIRYRSQEPLVLTIDSPVEGQDYFEPVTVAGSVQWDTAYDVVVSAEVQMSNNESTQALSLGVDESGAFNFTLNEVAEYAIIVKVQNGPSVQEQLVKFSLKPVEVSLLVKEDHPKDNNGVIDLVGPLQLSTTVEPSTNLRFDGYTIEWNTGEGWDVVAKFDPESLQGLNAQLTFDLSDSELNYGRYEFRVRLDYNEQLFTYSDSILVNYIASRELSLALDQPAAGQGQVLIRTPEILVSGFVGFDAQDSIKSFTLRVNGEGLNEALLIPVDLPDEQGAFSSVVDLRLPVFEYQLTSFVIQLVVSDDLGREATSELFSVIYSPASDDASNGSLITVPEVVVPGAVLPPGGVIISTAADLSQAL